MQRDQGLRVLRAKGGSAKFHTAPGADGEVGVDPGAADAGVGRAWERARERAACSGVRPSRPVVRQYHVRGEARAPARARRAQGEAGEKAAPCTPVSTQSSKAGQPPLAAGAGGAAAA
eukprot:CAMPEP_0202036742 /NCGR_PEP_ID=MMETSP0962-20130828/1746_1 /ASSEMBLY_ACC=CAM_ASM_000488 /TAXON_ID=4773 /ORGANISM="Schizochytrium aggregatum, Strain ATCC28209" /LENGTH=117 /DNA_ID=CAMNT_0048600837 /DNA_START=472 /DNA_END=822 /DNA_ORIENTATION=-